MISWASIKVYVLATVFLGLLGTNVYLRYALSHERDLVVAGQFSLDSLEAVKDTTRKESLAMKDDTLTLYRRRIVQTDLKADSLDKALHATSVARAELAFTVQNLQTVITGMLEKDSAGFSSAVHRRIPPFTVDLDIKIPPTLETISTDISVALDTAIIGARITCTEQDRVRSAELILTPPDWLSVDISEVQQERTVCNPEIVQPGYSLFKDPKVLIPGGIVVFEVGKALFKHFTRKPL